MRKSEQFKRVIMFFDSLVLIAAVAFSFGYVWNSYYNETVIDNPFWYYGNILLTVVYAAVYILFSRSFSGFRVGYLRPLGLIGSQIISIVCTNAITYIQISLIGRGFLPIVRMLLLTEAQCLAAIFWAILSTFIYRKIFPARKMIVVYGNKDAGALVVKMSERMDKYIICSSVSSDESIEDIKAKILEYEAVIICDVPPEKRSKILKFTFEKSIRTYIVPKISDIIVRGADEFHMFDTPLLLARNQGLSFEQKLLKRICDIVFSLIGIVVALPFMIIIAIAIMAYDRGPALYAQNRLTANGKVFKLYKFRSMITDAEKDGVARLAADGDDRITPVGRFIRKCRLDELPQLFNILSGDMSFVGPRPERPEIAQELEKTMPEFSFRLKVKAGLTGFAQVFGKYNTTPYDKLKLDLMYIERHSLVLDFRIMLMTLRTVFVPDSAEGVKETIPLIADDEDENAGKDNDRSL